MKLLRYCLLVASVTVAAFCLYIFIISRRSVSEDFLGLGIVAGFVLNFIYILRYPPNDQGMGWKPAHVVALIAIIAGAATGVVVGFSMVPPTQHHSQSPPTQVPHREQAEQRSRNEEAMRLELERLRRGLIIPTPPTTPGLHCETFDTGNGVSFTDCY